VATYAIVKTGGKQYRVEEGDTIRVETLEGNEGDTLELTDVVLVSQDGKVTVGDPTVPGARVTAQIKAHGKGKKLIVFKYKSKTRNRHKNGHRQPFVDLNVTGITVA